MSIKKNVLNRQKYEVIIDNLDCVGQMTYMK